MDEYVSSVLKLIIHFNENKKKIQLEVYPIMRSISKYVKLPEYTSCIKINFTIFMSNSKFIDKETFLLLIYNRFNFNFYPC